MSDTSAAGTLVVSKAGITTSSTGERHIPSSIRADGSVRKEIRVRPGYRPPEDVEKYKNRAVENLHARGKRRIPGAESLRTDEDVAKASITTDKTAKRREARKRAAAAAAATTAVEAAEGEGDGKYDRKEETLAESRALAKTVDCEAGKEREKEKEKEVKKLTKKLRQARELKDKKEKGDKLLPEQIEKVIKINELIRQLEVLGFDAEGVEKPDP